MQQQGIVWNGKVRRIIIVLPILFMLNCIGRVWLTVSVLATAKVGLVARGVSLLCLLNKMAKDR